MILDRMGWIIRRFGHPKDTKRMQAAGEMASRWRRAFRDEPELARDLIRLGRLFQTEAVLMNNGAAPELAPIDPYSLAHVRGQQSLATLLLSLGNLTVHELSSMLENDYE